MEEIKDFGFALRKLKEGKKVSRFGWNGKNMFLAYRHPSSEEICTLPYLVMFTADQKWVPWLASQTDVLAEDWEIVD